MRRHPGTLSAKARPERITVGSKRGMCWVFWIAAVFAMCCASGLFASPPADVDRNGYLDQRDYVYFNICFLISGPDREPLFAECTTWFDADADGDVDLRDFGGFSQVLGHLPMPLRDARGTIITMGSALPYSGRQTCGTAGCHDADRVSRGAWFQDGRTDVNGLIDMRDDYSGDGRDWIKSAGRYGKWGQSFQFLLSSKDNTSPSEMDQTAFAWVRDCGGCHPGGGPGELDRDGELYYDDVAGKFGYQKLDLSEVDVALDGDYSVLNYATGEARLARWDMTGLSGPDCLKCHRAQRAVVGGVDMNVTWRRSILAAGENLVDAVGNAVRAFEAAGTAGQGWFSQLSVGAQATGAGQAAHDGLPDTVDRAFLGVDEPTDGAAAAAPPVLQIDYSFGVTDGSLSVGDGGAVLLKPESLAGRPKDRACWGCHPYSTITGTTWFDTRDVHYLKFNNLGDADPSNDVPAEHSRACITCHPGNPDHDVAKGNSPQLGYRDQLDWVGFRTCRDCHLPFLPTGEPNPLKHADAPDVPSPAGAAVHLIGFSPGERGPMRSLSCQACHIPYALTPAVVFRDITQPGSVGMTSRYYSADPLNPADADKSRWYPSFIEKEDSDGVMRWFPANVWITFYFGDWDQNGTPSDFTDDVIRPIPTWRVAQVVGAVPPPLDDDADGRREINRVEEVSAFLQALKGNDAQGNRVSARPVLVRGQRVWYEDAGEPGGVNSFDHTRSGLAMEAWYPYLWELDHNVLGPAESWGAEAVLGQGCTDCHRAATLDSPVFDRKVLIDPLGPDNQTVYKTVREMTGLNPP